MKSWRYCLNFAQFRKDCNVSCSSCARRVNTTHFSGSSFPTIVKTISREEKYKMKCHILQRHRLLFHGLRQQPHAHVNSIAHWLCVLYVEPLSLTAPMVSGNTQGHFGKEKKQFLQDQKYNAFNGSERLLLKDNEAITKRNC